MADLSQPYEGEPIPPPPMEEEVPLGALIPSEEALWAALALARDLMAAVLPLNRQASLAKGMLSKIERTCREAVAVGDTQSPLPVESARVNDQMIEEAKRKAASGGAPM